MRYLVTAEEMRRYDEYTTEEIGIPAAVLMERAALAAFWRIEEYGRSVKGERTALVLAGMGNNGGDGIGAARLLFLMGLKVRVFLVGDYNRLTPDAMEETGRLSECGVELEPFDPGSQDQANWIAASHVLVDAVFGVGLSREIAPDSAAAAATLKAVLITAMPKAEAGRVKNSKFKK